MPNNIVNFVKKVSKKTIEGINKEHTSKSRSRFFVMVMYLCMFYLSSLILIVGRMLVDKVLIIVPTQKPSLDTIEIIRTLNTITEILYIFTLISAFLFAYKEYHNICIKRIIKSNGLEIIK